MERSLPGWIRRHVQALHACRLRQVWAVMRSGGNRPSDYTTWTAVWKVRASGSSTMSLM